PRRAAPALAAGGSPGGDGPHAHAVLARHGKLRRLGRAGRVGVPRGGPHELGVKPATIWVTIDSTCAITNRQKRFPTDPACLECRRRTDHGLPHAPRGSVHRPGPVDTTAYVHCGY